MEKSTKDNIENNTRIKLKTNSECHNLSPVELKAM
jgi:hypothetical protein